MTAETERDPNELTGAIEEAMAALRKLATLYEHSSYDDAKRAHNRLAALLPTLSAASPERVALPEQPNCDLEIDPTVVNPMAKWPFRQRSE
jgi:hypothetical protein